MANIEIAGKDFMNYTDLRKKNELPQIEVEQIKTYVNSLKGKALEILLAEIDDIELVNEIHRRMFDRKNKLDSVARYVGL